MQPEYAWMASVFESVWHRVRVSTCGPAPRAVCQHRLRGPVHRRLGFESPSGVGRCSRTLCAACQHAFATDVDTTLRKAELREAMELAGVPMAYSGDDGLSSVTGRVA